MNPSETQSDFEQNTKYFDLEAPDVSEQEFSASLEMRDERPRFVLDATQDCEVTLAPTSLASPEANLSQESNAAQGADQSPETGNESDWRDQVSATVNRYKSRRPREERYPSLQLKFEGSGYRLQAPEEAPCIPISLNPAAVSEDTDMQPRGLDNESRSFPNMSLEATARVLEFPRSGALPVRRDDQLADPVADRPRIVEAPELLPPPPAMGGILLEESKEPEPERRPGFEIPLHSARLSRRVLAGTLDAMVVAMALSGFGYIFFRITGSVPQIRVAASLTAGLAAVLWVVYQYSFLVFSGTTPGLRLARLTVNRFDGTPASRNLRRWRVLASLLSCVSLGLGYAWCLLDEDQLSWHDRITRTHLAPADTNSIRG